MDHQFYKNIVNTISEGVFVIDSDGIFIDVNRHFITLLGYSENEILQVNIKDIDLDLFNKLPKSLYPTD
jgi:PAS domain S-box-containing protein